LNEIAQAFIAACRDEIEAPKPGNVHIFAEGHGMTIDDFLRSAEIAAPPLCQFASPVGKRILAAVEATWASVGMNTNLGILLLCAPLAAATDLGGELHAALKTVLANLTRDDAQSAFQAILRASPAGLGRVARHDVRDAAETTLLQAMREASERDRIAYQYATDFSDIFEIGIAALEKARNHGWPPPWPAVSVYLAFLAGFPDSHIARKNGLEAATAVQAAALKTRDAFMTKSSQAESLDDLLDFDQRLKAAGLNPGTSADLTVATLFAGRISRILIQRPNNG
jgi:triphosphoribosyl-dephospho-CoA synthase